MATQDVDEGRLREAVRDDRYWLRTHPEYDGYRRWVNDGWRALSASGGGLVQVRAYERRGPDGDIVQVQAHQRSAPPRAWQDRANPGWREQIAREETNRDAGDFGYGMRGQPGTSALGRYQMNLSALRGAGWRDRQGAWTPRAAEHEVRSAEDFLRSPSAQEAAFDDYLRDNERQLRRVGAWALVGTTVPGLRGEPVTITAGGLAAAAHREGAPSVARYIVHRRQGLPLPQSVAGRGDLSRFNQIEARLRAFANTPYQAMSR